MAEAVSLQIDGIVTLPPQIDTIQRRISKIIMNFKSQSKSLD